MIADGVWCRDLTRFVSRLQLQKQTPVQGVFTFQPRAGNYSLARRLIGPLKRGDPIREQ